MGVTISHKLCQQKVFVKQTLDRAESLARDIQSNAVFYKVPVSIIRDNDYTLLVNIGGCETLAFEFKSVKQIMERDDMNDWSYEVELLRNFNNNHKEYLDEGYAIDEYPENELYYAVGYCKTQFGRSIVEHKYVADLIRSIATYCRIAYVYDEGDYYHSGVLLDATGAIKENGALIDSLVTGFTNAGYDFIKGNTIIK